MRLFLLCLLLASPLYAVTPVTDLTSDKEPKAKFSPKGAATYLDHVGNGWTQNRECFACHTNVFYMMARPKISGGDDKPLKESRDWLEAKVKDWDKKLPKPDYNVLAPAMALAAHDATKGKLSETTKKALDHCWTLQKADGSFNWPKCDWPPQEHDDYYGVAFMIVATGLAPEGYAKTEKAKAALDKMRGYLKKNPPPDLHHKAMLLWAESLVGDILSADEKKTIIADLKKLQRDDGGWSLPSLGLYKRRDKDKTPNDINAPSDGYATGFVVFCLRQGGIAADDANIKKGVEWIQANQRESGRWYTRSLNTDKLHLIANAGSAFCVLALDACGVKMKAE